MAVLFGIATAAIIFLLPSEVRSQQGDDLRTVEEKIAQAFPDEPRMLLVAYCESGNGCGGPIDPKAKNPGSSAKGVFQILDGTWKWASCKGDPLDEDDNIACARRVYDLAGIGQWDASKEGWSR